MLSTEGAALAPRFTRKAKLPEARQTRPADDGVPLPVRLAKLKRLVHETIIAHRKDFLTAFQYCSNLVQDVEAAFGTVDAQDEERIPGDLVGEIQSLRVLAQLHHTLQNFDSLLEIGEFKMAAAAVVQMMDLFEQLVDANGLRCDFNIYQLLKNDYAAKRARLTQYLNEMFAAGISIHQEGSSAEVQVSFRLVGPHAKKYYESSIPLEDVLSALYHLETLEAKFQTVATRLTQLCIAPCISSAKLDIQCSKSKLQAVLKLQGGARKSRGPGQSPALDQVLDRILQICRFVSEDVFPAPPPSDGHFPTETLLDVFGRTWWPSLWSSVNENVLTPLVPEDVLSLKHFQEELRPKVLEFGNALEQLGVLPAGRRELDDFVENIAALSTAKRRASILATARSVLLNEDINMVEVSDATERGGVFNLNGGKKDPGFDQARGKEGAEGKAGLESGEVDAFKVPRCSVSSQVHAVVEMAYQMVNEATSSDSKAAIELFYCARDLFDLMRCVRPMCHADPATATIASTLLFHNDCLYVSHHLLTIGYQYKSQLPPPLNETATFVDMIPSFRKLGETALRGLLRNHRDYILECLVDADLLRELQVQERFEKAERCFKDVIAKIETLSRSAKNILPSELYLSVIGQLVDTVVEQVLLMVPQLDTTSWQNSFQVKYILNLAAVRIERWFEISRREGNKTITEKVGDLVPERFCLA
ncbi:Centromere/kinetochore Zw10-domain-containing protein [Hyaloraphidium curvatum]|nr:Centromere/kinetochore Zw10-domain-containing protein [Hyaloraphidium curvatum]